MQSFSGFGGDDWHRGADVDIDGLNHGVDSSRKRVQTAVAFGWDTGAGADDQDFTAAAQVADDVGCTGNLYGSWGGGVWWWQRK